MATPPCFAMRCTCRRVSPKLAATCSVVYSPDA